MYTVNFSKEMARQLALDIFDQLIQDVKEREITETGNSELKGDVVA